jgi:hypothetical protein
MWPVSLIFLVFVFGAISGLETAVGQSSGSTTASITGAVRDQTGAVIPGATITAKNTETGLTRTVATGDDGAYLIPLLPPGTYDVSAESTSFAMQTIRRVTLTVGQTAGLDFSLLAAGLSESIEVLGEAPLIEPNRTQTSTTIDQQRIDNLPINRRNFLDFTLTTSSVTVDRIPAQGAAATSGLSFNGQSARQNNITIDGLDNNDYGSSSVRSTFSQEAIQEFQVVNNSFSAEFGRALGGIINIVTRGGTNELHGTTFFFVRNDALNARNAFAQTIPPFEQYQFGGTLGGPIVKDRHFFFGSFERLSLKDTNVITISDAVVQAARRIGFSPAAIRNGEIPFGEGLTQVLGRGDFQLAQNDTLWVRYTYARSFNGNVEPWGGLFAESFGGVGRLTDHNVGVSNTWIISPSLINETRFLFGHRRQVVDTLDPMGGPQVRIFAGSDQIVFGRGELLPQPRTEKIYEVVNNVSLNRGKHAVKIGADIYYGEAPPGTTAIPILFGGQVRFSDLDFTTLFGPFFTALQTFDPSLRTQDQIDFLDLIGANLPLLFCPPETPECLPAIPNLSALPIPQAFIQGFGNAEDSLSFSYLSGYVQDDIRLRPNFTLKAGLRYDLNTLPKPFPSNGGHGFGPRIAFAWDPTSNGKLLIHGAYGLFYGNTQLGPMFAVRIVDGINIKTPVLPFPFSLLGFLQPGFHFPETPAPPPGLPDFNPLGRIFKADPDFLVGAAHQASFGIDYLLRSNMSLSVNYQLVRGLHLFHSRNLNPVINPTCGPIPAVCGRLFPDQPEIYQFESSGDSYYHGVTLSVNRRMSNNFTFLAHYTFSKAIDDFVDWRVENQETGNPLNLRGERGLSLQDNRHRFVFSSLWELNYWKHRLVRGFALSSIITLNSGRPYNLLAGVDLNGDGDNPPGDRPAGLGRNIGISPGFANVDLRVTRNIEFNERAKVQLFFETFNLFNRLNVVDFGRVFPPGTPLPPVENGRFIVTPDRYRRSAPARQIQFGFRFQF